MNTSCSPTKRGTVSYDVTECPAKFVFHSEKDWNLLPVLFQVHPMLVDACRNGNEVELTKYYCNDSNHNIFVESLRQIPKSSSNYKGQQDDKCDSIYASKHQIDNTRPLHCILNSPSMLPEVDRSTHQKEYKFAARIDAISPIIYLSKSVQKSPPFRLMEIYSHGLIGRQSDNIYSASVVIKAGALELSEALRPGNKILLSVLLMKWCVDEENIPSFVYVANRNHSIRLVKEVTDIDSIFERIFAPLFSSRFRVESVISPSTQLLAVVDILSNRKTKLLLSFYPQPINAVPNIELLCFNLRIISCDGNSKTWGYVATLRSTVLKSTILSEHFQSKSKPPTKIEHYIYRNVQPLSYESIINRWYLARYIHPNQPHPILRCFNIPSSKIIDHLIPFDRIQRNPYTEFYDSGSFKFEKTSYINIEDLMNDCVKLCTQFIEEYDGSNGSVFVKYTTSNHSLISIYTCNKIHQNGEISIPFHMISGENEVKPEDNSVGIVKIDFIAYSIVKLFSCEKFPQSSDAQKRCFKSILLIRSESSNAVFLVMPHLFGHFAYCDKPCMARKLDHKNRLVRQRLRYQKVIGNQFSFYVTLYEKEKNVFTNNKVILELSNMEEINSQLLCFGRCSKEVLNVAATFYNIHNSSNASLTLCGWDEYINTTSCPDIFVSLSDCKVTSSFCTIDRASLTSMTEIIGSRSSFYWNAVGNIKYSDGLGFRNTKYLQNHPTIVLSDLIQSLEMNIMYCVQASLVCLSSVRCRMECSRCFMPLSCRKKIATDKSDEDSVPQQLECPKNECNSKYFVVIWSLSGILDDGTAQITLFAERNCALKLLRLTTNICDEKITAIEAACSTVEGGLCYLANTPPDSLFRFRIKCMSEKGVFKNKRQRYNVSINPDNSNNLLASSGLIDEQTTLLTVAKFYLYQASTNLKHSEGIFYLKKSYHKSQKEQVINLSQGKSEFYVANSQSQDFDRRSMMTTTLSKIFMNLLEYRSINDGDTIRNIQSMISLLET